MDKIDIRYLNVIGKMTAIESCHIRKSDKGRIKGSSCRIHLLFKSFTTA